MSKTATIMTAHEVPDHANYTGQDASGTWTWFQNEPYPAVFHIPNAIGDGWCAQGGDHGVITRSLPNPDWRDTLRKIDDPDWRRE